jgi:outer membrane protein assembly factor BamB
MKSKFFFLLIGLLIMSWFAKVSRATGTIGTSVPMGNDSLAGWWKLDEKSGTIAYDSSGHGNHGQLIGSPTWVDGRIGGALHFANTDLTKNYVDIPNSPKLENVQEGDYTIATWVWPDNLPPGTDVTPAYGIVVKQGRHIGLVYDQDGLFKMQHHSSAGYSLAKSARKSPGAWYHVAGVVSKSNGFVRIYVNGKPEATVNFTPGATAFEFGTETWKLGIAGPDYTKFREAMNGKVDDVRIYSSVLSDGEIAALAAQGNPQYGYEWPQFRGPGGSGIAGSPESSNVPTEWDTTRNVVWRIDVPGLGWSSPIVRGNRIFLTTAVDARGTEQPEEGFYLGKDRGGQGEHRWLVLACNLNTGEKLWEHTVHQATPPPTHLKSSYASATPVTDGERVYAWFGECGVLVALNAADGDEVWSFTEPSRKSRENWGFGASLVMHCDRIYLVHDNDEDAYIAAFDASTGKEIWRVKRPPETNWSTPLVWDNGQRTELVVAATGGIKSYDMNGELLWELHGMSRITVPNPVAANGMVYVGSGFVADQQKPLYAIRPGASGDISLKEGETGNPHIAWRQENAAPYVPSFLVAGKYLYVIQDRGQLSCYDAVNGTLVYEEKLRGHFTASPWMCGDNLFFLNERGETYVVQSGPTFRLLSTNMLERLCLSTPAVAGDRLLIRTSSRLYCIGCK